MSSEENSIQQRLNCTGTIDCKTHSKCEVTQHQNLVINTLCDTYLFSIDRNNLIEDNVTRQLLFIDKLCIMLDIGLAMGTNTQKEVSKETQKKIQNTICHIKLQLKSLYAHIQLPHLSPDHPCGNAMMMEAKSNFNNNKDK